MITKQFKRDAQSRAAALMKEAGITIYPGDEERIEVTDFGLSNPSVEGAQILTWVQTERIGVKIIALFPFQTLPEHWHPPVGKDAGKEETVRHIWGDLVIGMVGDPTEAESGSKIRLPEGKDGFYTCRRVIEPAPGEQITFPPGEKHWFHGGPRGAVAFSFSTVVRDALDQFSDPGVDRITKIVESLDDTGREQ